MMPTWVIMGVVIVGATVRSGGPITFARPTSSTFPTPPAHTFTLAT